MCHRIIIIPLVSKEFHRNLLYYLLEQNLKILELKKIYLYFQVMGYPCIQR